MSLKGKLQAKSAGIRAQVDEELSRGTSQDKPVHHPRTAIGQASAFQLAVRDKDARIAELEAKLRDVARTAIPVDAIEPNPWQPRKLFDEDEIRDLADSISELGLIQPIIVRIKSVSPGDTPPLYELIAGERRLRAHRLLGIADIQAVIANVSDVDMALMALAENLDREDLSDYEVAQAIRRAESEFPSRKRMAEAIGRGRQDFYRYLTFDSLPAAIKADLDANPRLMGRKSADMIVRLIKNHSARAENALLTCWPRVVAGEIDQAKLPSMIKAAILSGEQQLTQDRESIDHAEHTERGLNKLFVGKEQVGNFTRDDKTFRVTIKTTVLSPEKENQLRDFVKGLLKA